MGRLMTLIGSIASAAGGPIRRHRTISFPEAIVVGAVLVPIPSLPRWSPMPSLRPHRDCHGLVPARVLRSMGRALIVCLELSAFSDLG